MLHRSALMACAPSDDQRTLPFFMRLPPCSCKHFPRALHHSGQTASAFVLFSSACSTSDCSMPLASHYMSCPRNRSSSAASSSCAKPRPRNQCRFLSNTSIFPPKASCPTMRQIETAEPACTPIIDHRRSPSDYGPNVHLRSANVKFVMHPQESHCSNAFKIH